MKGTENQILQDRLPGTLQEAVEFAHPELFPNVRVLLKILLTLPVTTASAERSFSRLKLLKTEIRNRCGQERTSELAMMMMHRNIKLNYNNIVDKFLCSNRR